MESNANQPRKCDGQCQMCPLYQQTYCSAVRMYTLMNQQGATHTRLEHIEEALDALTRAVEKIAPAQRLITPIAQKGDGAENRSPIQQL